MNLLRKKLFISSLIVAILFSFVPLSNAGSVGMLDINTKQVRTADDSTVFYLDHKIGKKKAYVNEIAFLAYGNQWSDVRVVAQAELDRWPDVELVKSSANANIYFIKDSKKYLIRSAEEFLDYGFRWEDIIEIAVADLGSYKLTTSSKIINSSGGGNSNFLQVSLDESSPEVKFIPTGSANNTIGVLNFYGQSGTSEINNITLTLSGVFDSDIIETIYIKNEHGRIIGEAPRPSKKAYINFGNDFLVINSGEERKLSVNIDLRGEANVLNNTLSVSILDYYDINTNASVSGIFPIRSAEHKIVDGTNYLGSAKVEHIVLDNNIKSVKIGTKREAISSWRFSETSGREDLYIKSLTLTNTGNANSQGVENIRLYNDNGRLLAESQMFNQRVEFNFSDGYLLRKNHSEDFIVKVDIIGGDNKDIKFIIKNKTDIKIESVRDGYGIGVNSDYSFPLGSECGNSCNKIFIEHQPLFVTSKKLKDDELNIYRDQADAVIGLFELRNDSRNIKINNITASVVTSAGAPVLDGSLRLIDSDSGYEFGSIDAGKITNSIEKISLFNYQVAPRDTVELAFVVRIPDNVNSGETYKVFIEDVNYDLVDENKILSDNVNSDGHDRLVVKPGVYIFAEDFDDRDVFIAGNNKVKIAGFRLEATSDEKIRVNTIVIANATGFTNVDYVNGFTNLALYKGSRRISDIIARPHANSYTFEISSLKISAGKSVEISIKTDVSDNVSSEVKLVIENIMATGYESEAPVEINNKGTQSLPAKFSESKISIEALSGGTINQEDDNLVASFSLTNEGSEKIKLKYITVVTEGCFGGLSNSNGFSNLKFGYEVDNKIKKAGSSIRRPVAESNRISMHGHRLEAGETKILNLYIDAEDSMSSCTLDLNLRDVEAYGYYSKVKSATNNYETNSVGVVLSNIIDNENNSNNALAWPVTGRVNYDFHDRQYPFRDVAEHEGIDIEADQGTAIRSAGAGTISGIYDGGSQDYSYIVVNHGNGISTLYGHVSSIDVSVGDRVAEGEVIGLSGGEPGTQGAGQFSTGPHLHFEVRENSVPVDPEDYLS